MAAETVAINGAVADNALGFRIGEWGFLLPVSVHCEVLERLQVNPIPHVEPWFSGLLNVRGHIVPVVDLRVLLGDGTEPPKQRHLLAIDRGDKAMAIWIDGYPQLLMGSGHSFQATPSLATLPGCLQPFVTQGYFYNDQVWLRVQFELLFKTLGAQQAHQASVL